MSFASHLVRIALLTVSVVLFASASRIFAQGSPSPTTATVETHLGRGYDALKNEQYDSAVTEFRAALEMDPKLAERARFPLAVALFEMHQYPEARHEFESLRREVGDHPNILYYLGRLDLDNGDYKAAAQSLSKAVVKPPFPDTAYYLGVSFFKDHRLAEAEKWLKIAAHYTPEDSRVEYQLGKLYRQEGRDADARQALARSTEKLKLEDNASRLKRDCAQALDAGSRDEAHRVCEQLYDPDNAATLTSLGTIYGQHGDLDDALRCFQRAAELQPQSPQMQYNLALTFYQLNQFANARTPLEHALDRWPDLFQLNALYGAVLAKLGEEESACRALRRAHELNPQDSGTGDLLYLTTLQLAEKRQQARQYSHALESLREAAKLKPQEPEPHRRMAEIYLLTSQADQATAERREADRLNKNSAN